MFGILALQGIWRLAALVLDPASALGVFFLILLFGAWRLVSMVDLVVRMPAPNRRLRRRTTVTFAVLALVVGLSHGWAAFVAWSFWDAGNRVFVAEPEVRATPAPGQTSDPDDDFLATPFATPETREARVNILLIGIDSAEARTHALTDTMLVVSADPLTGKIAMVSFPRDIADFPLWDGRTYTGKINSFMTWARNHPDAYPDGPLGSLARELGFLLGVPVQYYAAVDLAGFKKMVDAVGGVTITNPHDLNDPTYGWFDGRKGFHLAAGTHTLDGDTALAYVRTRKSLGDSDFGRARRQQDVLLALRESLLSPATVVRIPEITQAAGDTVRTNFPSERIGEFLKLAQLLDGESVERVVLGPPYARRAVGPGVTDYRIRLDMDRLQDLSIKLFGTDSAYVSN